MLHHRTNVRYQPQALFSAWRVPTVVELENPGPPVVATEVSTAYMSEEGEYVMAIETPSCVNESVSATPLGNPEIWSLVGSCGRTKLPTRSEYVTDVPSSVPTADPEKV